MRELTMRDIMQIDAGPNGHLVGTAGSRARLSTPALLLDLDAMQRNIERMAHFARDKRISLRPHTKGGKSIAIARRQVEAGAIGICCTTIGEAEVMGAAGISSILITSPIVTDGMIERLMKLNGIVAD